MMMWRKLLVGLACLALAPSVFAAEFAVLRNGFQIRHAQREEIGSTTRLYLSRDRQAGYIDVVTAEIASFEHDNLPVLPAEPAPAMTESRAVAGPAAIRSKDALAATALNVKPVDVPALVNRASDQHLVDADLISSVIHAESGFNHHAVSPKGAQGLMQLMPGTAGKLGVKDAFDPADNVDGGTRYLRELLLRYNNDMAKALAAYNAGPERVDQYHGVPPYRETHDYVVRVIKDYNRKKRAARQHAPSRPASRKTTPQQAAKRPHATKKTVSASASASQPPDASKM
jgi:soluble lytic murein transglycosylase-like protein